MTRARLFILVVIVSLAIAAVALSPKREERAAMLAGEGRHKEAIALLERRLAGAPRDPDLLAALGRSYAALGALPQAVDAFDAYLAVRPDDVGAGEREAELLLRNGSLDRYLRALTRLTAAQPSAARITRLVELFRLHGRVEDEVNTLQAFAGRGILDAAQLERLGALLAERGDWRSAGQWLKQADLKAPPDASAGRFLLLDVLILGNEADQIEDRAQAWMAAWRGPFLSGKLILRIAQSGRTRMASRLALRYADIAPDDALKMVDFFAGKGREDVARQMLAHWVDPTTRMDAAQLHAFVQASARVGEIDVALGRFLALARSGSNPSMEGQLAEELLDSFGRPALAAIRPYLSNETLQTRPLFAADLALSEGNRELARRYLGRIDPAQLPADKLTTWLALEHRVDMDPDAFRRLAIAASAGRLPTESPPRLADGAASGQGATRDRVRDPQPRLRAARAPLSLT
jgi:tetratricopeptide (TPR) repeat protein